MRNKPVYALDSVDNALRLIQLLRDQGRLRVKDAAAELNVAPSTAHRLMSMLVYRGFALQDDSRLYLPGPSMGVGPARLDWTRVFRDLAQTQLEILCDRTGETVNLVIRIGTQVRFLASVESAHLLRVGNRQGTVLPARRTSGGKALLAELEPARLANLYRAGSLPETDEAMADADFDRLIKELRLVRRRGYAMNKQETEESVVAYGMSVHDRTGRPVGAVSVSMPITRYKESRSDSVVGNLKIAVVGIEHDVAGLGESFDTTP